MDDCAAPTSFPLLVHAEARAMFCVHKLRLVLQMSTALSQQESNEENEGPPSEQGPKM